ncbi:MAG: LysM domain-containing protein, partial [Leptothrix sp. (in: b-proteobacteria)]
MTPTFRAALRAACTARVTRLLVCGLTLSALAACTSTSLRPHAPVEDRSVGSARPAAPVPAPVPAPAPSATSADAPKAPPGAENAGKLGYYSVRPGDTLIRIGLETGQNWRDLQRWNNLDNADRIEV